MESFLDGFISVFLKVFSTQQVREILKDFGEFCGIFLIGVFIIFVLISLFLVIVKIFNVIRKMVNGFQKRKKPA